MIHSFLDMAQTEPKLFVTAMVFANAAILMLVVAFQNAKESLNDLKNRR